MSAERSGVRREGEKIPVAVLGATGSVGQRFVALLEDHPWFDVAAVTASERSAGRPYREAVRWVLPTPIPRRVAEMEVGVTGSPLDTPVVFSALDGSVAGPVETEFAGRGHLVVSNAPCHRMDPDVPLVIPEVNPGHLDLAREQGGPGALLTNPNCSTSGLVLALAPLASAFGVERAHVVTLQALSGAGYPGVASLDVADNIVPHIPGEEDKLETETLKILGRLANGRIEPAALRVSAQCTRVPVVDGHTACISVSLARDADPQEVQQAWSAFQGEPQRLGLPTAPERPVVYLEGPDCPQPRLHRDLGRGMTVSVGRLRPCPLLGIKFVALSHNTIRGAAGGALLTAELAVARGIVNGLKAPEPAP